MAIENHKMGSNESLNGLYSSHCEWWAALGKDKQSVTAVLLDCPGHLLALGLTHC